MRARQPRGQWLNREALEDSVVGGARHVAELLQSTQRGKSRVGRCHTIELVDPGVDFGKDVIIW
jgi:hypothetical protein